MYGFTQPDPNSPLVASAGVMVDVTSSVDATVHGICGYMRRIENMLIHSWLELARAKGETCGDVEILRRLRDLDTEVNGSVMSDPVPSVKSAPQMPRKATGARPYAPLYSANLKPLSPFSSAFKVAPAPKLGL